MTLIGKFKITKLPFSQTGRRDQWLATSRRGNGIDRLDLLAIGPTITSVQEFVKLATWAARTGHF
jgi:hypothetical protein